MDTRSVQFPVDSRPVGDDDATMMTMSGLFLRHMLQVYQIGL